VSDRGSLNKQTHSISGAFGAQKQSCGPKGLKTVGRSRIYDGQARGRFNNEPQDIESILFSPKN